MNRALRLADKGKFEVSPNPRVGCVIVFENRIIGEGYHRKFGEAHAEVNAIESVADQSLLANSTLYVSLEPCSHTGKTPPCVDLILKHKIPKVVIANKDPFKKVNGSGIEKLRGQGVEVIEGVLESEGRIINKRFFTFHQKRRPYIILKWAQTADGFIGRNESSSKKEDRWISNSISKQLVHLYRAEEDAILVGRKTVTTDNPSLTCREVSGKNPVRMVIDKELSLIQDHQVFDEAAKTIILNQHKSEVEGSISRKKIDFNNFHEEFNALCVAESIQSVIVEGGAYTLRQFIQEDNWDEARIFVSSKEFKSGVKAPEIKGSLISEAIQGGDRLSIYKNKNT